MRELRRRAAAEIIDGARDEIAAFLPQAHSAVRVRREEGVERVLVSAGPRAREDHGLAMKLLVDLRIRIRPRPVLLVRGPVEVESFKKHPLMCTTHASFPGTQNVVVEPARVVRAGNRAVEVRVELRAVPDVPDL